MAVYSISSIYMNIKYNYILCYDRCHTLIVKIASYLHSEHFALEI